MTETYEYWKTTILSIGTTEYFNDIPYNFYNDCPCYVGHDYVSFYKLNSYPPDNIRHRLDGPSVVFYDGSLYWFINDNDVAEYNSQTKKWSGSFYDWTVEQNMDIDNLTDEDKTLIKLVWS